MTAFDGLGAITFDVGGTLIEPWPSVGHVYARIAAASGVQGLSAELLNQRFGEAWRSLTAFHYTQDEWANLVDRVFHGLTAQPPRETFFGKLYSAFGQKDAWKVFNDVLPALDNLASRGLKLGVVSNWDDRLQPLLQALKLHSYFDAVIVSCEVGFCKPSSVIFEQAAAKLALPPEAILHVGDDLQNDVEGARDAGLRALELRRLEAPRAGQIQSLLELLDAVEIA